MNKTATELQAMAGMSQLTLRRWADELEKNMTEDTFTKMSTTLTLTRTFDFGSFAIATRVTSNGRLVMKRIISAAELARTGVIAAGDPEVRADVTDQNISDIADALRASLRRASLPTCPHTLTLVPPADLHAKIPEYAFLITQLLDERGALYAALERLEIKP